jgi:hypothetical protein
MELIQKLLSVAALSCIASFASAQTTFVFDDGSSTGAAGLALEAFAAGIDGASMSLNTSGTYAQGGFTLSAGTDFGTFNLTNSGFGPNDTVSEDDTDFFDGSESMVFSFDTAGTFSSIDFASLDDAPETAILSFAGGNTFNLLDGITSDIAVSGNDFFDSINESFTAGQLITLSISGGNGWTLESLTVVPEPGTYALLAGFSALAFIMLRRRSVK